jgi:hypothetical protein
MATFFLLEVILLVLGGGVLHLYCNSPPTTFGS